MKNTIIISITNNVRRLVYITLGKFDERRLIVNPIVILCYHSIADDGWGFSTPLETLDQQMSLIKKTHRAVKLSEIVRFIEGKSKFKEPVFAVTFDDGYKNVFTAKQMFAKHSVTPSVFLLSESEQVDRANLGNNLKFLNRHEISLLKRAGWEFGSHGNTHRNLDELSAKDVANEVIGSVARIRKNYTIKPKTFAYPKGRYTTKILRLVKKGGYKAAYSMDDGFISRKSNIYKIPRVGVMNTHTLGEFKYMYSPSVVFTRKQVKQLFGIQNK